MKQSRLIVIVEDDSAVLELLRDIFRIEGFDVVGVLSPKVLLESLNSLQPDLFLIDVMLPGMSGIELAERVRAAGQQAPIIAMSASKLMLRIASQSEAIDESVDKAFDAVELVHAIETYLLAPILGDRESQLTEVTTRQRPE